MKFTKMHGCGNDYIYINCFEEAVEDPAALAVRLSDRHKGVGGDGGILVCPSDCLLYHTGAAGDLSRWQFVLSSCCVSLI